MLFLHDQSIREYGGYHGVRDEALLSSALNRPCDKWDYERADLFALAAAYAFGISKNHAFLDGNKRTAWACCVLFLKANGVKVDIAAMAAVENVVALAVGGISEIGFGGWLRGNARP